MSRIFLSHSSVDEPQAVALKHWLGQNGWDDVFLDVDPKRGLIAGERWQEALRRAADRCEVVVFVVSPAWAKSKWCLAEFLLAKSLRKRIFGVVLKEVAIDELPKELTSEWQLCHLIGSGSMETVTCKHHEQDIEITFLADGLRRLKNGLQAAGLGADFFPWPPSDDPQRAPYRGLQPLESADAAVYFGRDTEILQGLDKLRGMREPGAESLFVILGASGTGKSSYIRAGLLPRLRRDDRHFFPLQPIRPELRALSGEHGLAAALHDSHVRLKLPHSTLGETRKAVGLGAERLAGLLDTIQQAAHTRLWGPDDEAPPTTLVLAIDQAEELFNSGIGSNAQEAGEASAFLDMIGKVLRDNQVKNRASLPAALIVIFTIRTDRYEALQTAPQLSGLKTLVFDALKPMPRAQFKEVIIGPAQRATAAGQPLKLQPALVDRLLADCEHGGDTLPLLGLTMARLYRDYGDDGDLRMDEYEHMGGLAHVVKNEAESIVSTDPDIRAAQLGQLRDAFIPALVTINQDTDQPMRRVARLADLPSDGRPLIRALIDRHLLLSDLRAGEQVVEVAHESLFRQWDVLVDWLREERGDLKDIDLLEQAAVAWRSNGQKEDWLIQGERLARAETLAATPRYGRRLETTREFLAAARQRGNQLQDEEIRQREERLNAETARRQEAERDARRLTLKGRWLIGAVIGAVGALVIAIGAFWNANLEKQRTTLALMQKTHLQEKTKSALLQTNGLRLAYQGMAMLDGKRPGGDERALLQLIAAGKITSHFEVEGAHLSAILATSNLKKLWSSGDGWSLTSVAFSPDGTRIVSGKKNGTLQLWDVSRGQPIGQPIDGHTGEIYSVAFSPDGTRIVSGDWDGTLRLWDASSGQPINTSFPGNGTPVAAVAFSPDGTRIVSGGWDGTLRLWSSVNGQPISGDMQGHTDKVSAVAFNPDGTRIVSGSEDKTLRLWDASSGQPIGQPLKGYTGKVLSVAFTPDGTRIVSGDLDGSLGLWLWNGVSGQPISGDMQGHIDRGSVVAFSPDGKRIVSGSEDATLRLWEFPGDQPLGQPIGQLTAAVYSVDFSPDGTRIVSGNADARLQLWDASSGQPIGRAMQGHTGSVRAVAFDPDGTRIVSGSSDTMLRLWDVSSGQPIGQPLEGHTGGVFSVEFSPDGTRIISGDSAGTLRLWDASSGLPIGQPLEGHTGGVFSVAFSPDGSRIVSGDSAGTLRLLDATSGQPIGGAMQGHTRSVSAVAFNLDGTRIVSGSADATLRLWDASIGQPVGSAIATYGLVKGLSFTPEQIQFVSIERPLEEDMRLESWPAPQVWPDRLCAKLTRNMSRKEWREWIAPDTDYVCQCPGLPIPADESRADAKPEICPPKKT